MAAQDMIIEADRLYDGTGAAPIRDAALLLRGGRIEAVGATDPGARLPRLRVPVAAPGFVDLQINGAADVMFNDTPTPQALHRMARGAAQGGTAYILPTFITAPGRAYGAALTAAREALATGVPGILGLHLEGPFLSPRRPGIHPAEALRRPDGEDCELLSAGFPGARLITLAPEEVPAPVIRRLREDGWTVFAGHSEASLEQCRQAADCGVSGVTHLFNAMSQITPREPGLTGAAFCGTLRHAGIIADGHHVHPANLALAARVLGPERLCLVTDAMPTLAGRLDRFRIGATEVRLTGGRLLDANGTLGGAHLSMDEALRNMIRHAGLRLEDALRMASGTPAEALGLSGQIGRLAPGYRAGVALLDDGFRPLGTVSDGEMTFLAPSTKLSPASP